MTGLHWSSTKRNSIGHGLVVIKPFVGVVLERMVKLVER